MASEDLGESIQALFTATAKAHHAAFIEADGDDPEWPLWYAEHLRDELNGLLDTTLTTSELVYLIVRVDKEHAASAPGTNWQEFWTAFFLDHTAR